MYRRYYRYNDPAPGQKRPAPPAPPQPPAPKPQSSVLPLEIDRLFSGMEKDDLILAGLLLLLLLGEDKESPDLPLLLALLYLLLRK